MSILPEPLIARAHGYIYRGAEHCTALCLSYRSPSLPEHKTQDKSGEIKLRSPKLASSEGKTADESAHAKIEKNLPNVQNIYLKACCSKAFLGRFQPINSLTQHIWRSGLSQPPFQQWHRGQCKAVQ